MNALKRATLSITRRPGKSLILFLIVFIIGNLIAGTVAIRQAVVQAQEVAVQSMNTVVTLIPDAKALAHVSATELSTGIKPVDAQTIKLLGAHPKVRYYDYVLRRSLESTALRPVDPVSLSGNNNYAYAPGREDFILRGTHYAPLMLLEEGRACLLEGRTFSEGEIEQSSMVGLISDRLAEENGIHVGETITLRAAVYDRSGMLGPSDKEAMLELGAMDVVLEVIGIITMESTSTEGGQEGFTAQNLMSGSSMSQFFNTIFVPIGIAEEIEDFTADTLRSAFDFPVQERSYSYSATFVLNEPQDLEAFETYAATVLPQFWTTQSDRKDFERVATPLNAIRDLMQTALIVIVCAAVVLITLVIVLFLRDRRHEFGIYLSLGDPKVRVLSQVLIEVVLVALVALVLALFTGALLSGTVSQFMLENQPTPPVVPEASLIGPGMSMVYAEDPLAQNQNTMSYSDILAHYQVGFSAVYVLLFLGIGLGTVVVACALSMLYVLRLKPKKILM